MCPEMIMTKGKDKKMNTLSYSNGCDWWACGVLLYDASLALLPRFTPRD